MQYVDGSALRPITHVQLDLRLNMAATAQSVRLQSGLFTQDPVRKNKL